MLYMVTNREVDIPLYRESESRINNQCSQSFLRRIDSADHRSWNGTGMSARCPSLRISADTRSDCIPAGNDNGWEPVTSPSCAAG